MSDAEQQDSEAAQVAAATAAQALADAAADVEAARVRQQQVARAGTQKENVSYPGAVNREKNSNLSLTSHLEKAAEHWNGAPGSGRSFQKTLLQSLQDQAYEPDGQLSD